MELHPYELRELFFLLLAGYIFLVDHIYHLEYLL